jgi:hypothetical protein
MADYTVEYLSRLFAAVERFEAAFEEWMKTQHAATHVEARGLFPTVTRKKNASEAEVARLELAVAEAAGAAARAVQVTGAYIVVQGAGALDPIANWALMAVPRAPVAPSDVRLTAATVRGRLQSMLDDREALGATGSSAPAFSPAQTHELVWAAAAAHWTTHQYRVAVREAAEALTAHWMSKLGRTGVDALPFWQQTLAAGEPAEGLPKLVWPGDPDDKGVRTMRNGLAPLALGLKGLAEGLNSTVRNPTTHSRGELTEQEAMERLAAYSFLARLLDQCEIRTSDG